MTDKQAANPAPNGTCQRLDRGRTAEPSSSTISDIAHGDRQRTASGAFRDLPPELVGTIVEKLVTNSPRETARNLQDCKLVTGYSPEQLAKIDVLRDFSSTLAAAGRLAMDLHLAVYTNNGLDNCFSTAELIDTVGPVLKFQPPRMVSEVVEHVLAKSDTQDKADSIIALAVWLGDLDPKDRSSLTRHVLGNSELDARASTIAALAAQFQYLDPACRASLITEAFRLFRQRGATTYAKLAACDAIALAHDYLEPGQRLELKHSPLRATLDMRIGSIEQEREEINSTVGNGREPDMEELREMFESASRDATITEQQRIEELGQIAETISRGFIRARAELENAVRRREILSR